MTDVLEFGRTAEQERSDRARAAVKAFRSLQPTLTAYARAFTKNPRVIVELSAKSARTDGHKIYFRPPLELGDNTPHNRKLCNKRDDVLGTQRCPACAVREKVIIQILHEISHMAEGTFAPIASADLAYAVERAVNEAPGRYADAVRARMENLPDRFKTSYQALSASISPFLPGIVNAFEDARINERLFTARRGTRRMFEVFMKQVLNGTVGDDVAPKWTEMPLNAQVVTGLFCVAGGYDVDGFFAPEVEIAMHDPQIMSLCAKAVASKDVAAIYELAFPTLARLRELGFCKAPDDPEPEPEPEQEQSDEQEPEDSPPSESDGDPDPDQQAEAGPPSDSAGTGEGESPEGSGESEPSDSSAGDGDGEPNPDSDSDSGSGRDGDKPDDDSEASPESEGNPQDVQSGDSDDADSDASESDADSSDDAEAGQSGDSPADESDSDGSGSPDSEEGESSEADASDPGADEADSGTGVGDDEENDQSGEGSSPQDVPDDQQSDGEGAGGTPEHDTSDDDGKSDSSGDREPDGEPQDADGLPDEAPSGDSGESGSDDAPERDGDPTSQLRNDSSAGDQVPDADDATGGSDLGSGSGRQEPDQSSDGREVQPEAPGESRDDAPVASEPETGGLDEAAVEDEDDSVVDTGADEGIGGVHAFDPDEHNMGTAEEVNDLLKEALQHDEHNRPESAVWSPEDEKALETAVMQSLYFESESRNVCGVRINRRDKPGQFDGMMSSFEFNAWDRAAGYSEAKQRKTGVTGEFDPDESVLGPALLKMRRVFADNRRGKVERNLKSGKVSAKVLGKRAPVSDPRLFRHRTLPGKKDYAVVIGMDISGSNVGESIILLKRAVMAQANLLSRMGIDFCIIAHSGVYSEDRYSDDTGLECILDIYFVKEWNEPWAEKQKQGLRDIGAYAVNLDGHALEWLRKEVDKQAATDKVIMYYSDGKMPAENYEEELEVLQREIKTCKRKNIKLLGVGIRTDSPSRHGLDTVEVHVDADIVKVVKHLEKHLA